MGARRGLSRGRAASSTPQGRPLRISVNLSPAQLGRGRISSTSSPIACSATAWTPSRLGLELTETLFMQDTPREHDHARGVACAGVRIVLDDFGTGYSSLAYLRRLPAGRLKLDHSFVRRLTGAAAAPPAVAGGSRGSRSGSPRPSGSTRGRRRRDRPAAGRPCGPWLPPSAGLSARPPTGSRSATGLTFRKVT